jgi:hypothetical protein
MTNIQQRIECVRMLTLLAEIQRLLFVVTMYRVIQHNRDTQECLFLLPRAKMGSNDLVIVTCIRTVLDIKVTKIGVVLSFPQGTAMGRNQFTLACRFVFPEVFGN